MEELSTEEIFILLPKLCLYKSKKDGILKRFGKGEIVLDAKEIFKVLSLNPESRISYALLEKWSSPQYLFLKKVKPRKPYKYTIEDKTFWNYIRKRNFNGLTFFNFIQTKITIIE